MPDDAGTQIIPPPPRPRQMMIKNLMPRLPERGKIKIGAKGQMVRSRQGTEFQPPVKLDHFRITTLERGPDGNFLRDDDFHRRFGERPTEIPVRLLYDDPVLNFQTRYACFVGRTLWCSGDGETAIRLSETAPRNRQELEALQPRPHEVQCPCFRQEPSYQGRDKCKMNGNLSVIIEGASGLGGVWNFRTTSYNSIVGIMSSMEFIRMVTGGPLANIPLRLRIQRKQATAPTDGSQVTIYVVGLEFEGNVEKLQQTGHQIALDRATTHVSIAEIQTEARRRLALAPPDVPLPGDDANDIVEEFYPEQVNTDEPPPRPRREAFADTEINAEQISDFRVVSYSGFAQITRGVLQAVSWLREAIDEGEQQRGDIGVSAVWESNGEFIYDLRERGYDDLADELAAYYAERLANAAQHDTDPGVRQDRPQKPNSDPIIASGGATMAGEASDAGSRPSLAVAIRKQSGSKTDWEGTAADMIAVIDAITDPADTRANGRFKQENREALEEMRKGDRTAWSTVEYRLGDRARELREGSQ